MALLELADVEARYGPVRALHGVSLAVDEQYYIQMDPDLDEPRASIWGMDNASTQIAVSVFIERFLPRFLEQCATSTSNPTDLDDTD